MTSRPSPRRSTRTAQLLVRLGSALALAGTAHTVLNLRLMRRPDAAARPPDSEFTSETVSVLLPLRDEADRVRPCLDALLVAVDTARAAGLRTEVVVLDDGSTDGTGEIVRSAIAAREGMRLVQGEPLPDGWLGKPWACQQLADLADDSTVLVFLDADVVLAPHALVAAVAMLRRDGLDLVSPYPRQRAESWPERLVQPLLQWSWLTTLPLRIAETSPRASMAAANGQLLVVDARTYAKAGGHSAVRADVLDDMALMRAVKAVGGRGGMADGTELATCRMYDGWAQVRAGYTKSLWSAFGSPAAAAGALGTLGLAYLVPAAAALAGSSVGALGYAAGVGGRALVARRVGGRVWPDSAAHPLSVLALAWLTAESFVSRRRGRLSWRGRPVG
ncbi:MAG: glycosyltransferase [Actinomycetes bacterium]